MLTRFLSLIALLSVASCNVRQGKTGANDTTVTATTFAEPPSDRDSDSVALLQLTKRFYDWTENKDKGLDFAPVDVEKTEGLYTGIDMAAQRKRLAALLETGFFTEHFLRNYHAIALAIDAALKAKTITWAAGDMPPFSNGASPWCNCQDEPENFLDKIYISSLSVHGDKATYNWSWGEGDMYHVEARKEMGTWKVDHLEGFDLESYKASVTERTGITGKWKGGIVALEVGEDQLAFEYHGQCVYFYPVHKLSDSTFEMIWARDMDCKFDNGTDKTFGLKDIPVIGKPFAKYTLRNSTLQAEYYYKEWVNQYTKQVQDGVFEERYEKD